MSKKLLESRADLENLLDSFYSKVKIDPLIGPIFNDVAKVHWEHHIPKIYDFWESLLFGTSNYKGRPFPPHIPLNLELIHFQKWLELFFTTVDEGYEGAKANEIKSRAFNIGQNFLNNIRYLKKNSSEEPSSES